MTQSISFPLFERAVERGLLEGKGALVVAPTATGKSFIGREVVRSALESGKPGPHAYLVPFRSLANEVYDGFHDLLATTDYRLRIATGDYREPVRPEESDLIVATYESFAALVRRTGLAPGTVIADEIHLVADDHRGPVVEGLLSRLLASGRMASLCGLSAVVENGEELAEWLGVEFLEGTSEDRPVVLEFRDKVVHDLDKGLEGELRACLDGQQGLVFCSSRRGAEKTARFLSAEMKPRIPVDTVAG